MTNIYVLNLHDVFGKITKFSEYFRDRYMEVIVTIRLESDILREVYMRQRQIFICYVLPEEINV